MKITHVNAGPGEWVRVHRGGGGGGGGGGCLSLVVLLLAIWFVVTYWPWLLALAILTAVVWVLTR